MAEFDMDLAAARVAEQADEAEASASARFARSGPVVGKASDDAIEVEVAPGGLLTGVTIHRSALRHGSSVIADRIFELAQRATRRAGDRMYHALAPVVDASQLEALGYEPIPDDDTYSYGR